MFLSAQVHSLMGKSDGCLLGTCWIGSALGRGMRQHEGDTPRLPLESSQARRREDTDGKASHVSLETTVWPAREGLRGFQNQS